MYSLVYSSEENCFLVVFFVSLLYLIKYSVLFCTTPECLDDLALISSLHLSFVICRELLVFQLVVLL